MSEGSLPVPGAEEVLHAINRLRRKKQFDLCVLLQACLPEDHCCFVCNNPGSAAGDVIPLPDVGSTRIFPRHCVRGTPGAALNAGLLRRETDLVVETGHDPLRHGYSPLRADVVAPGQSSLLKLLLRRAGITDIFCVGLGTDVMLQNVVLDIHTLMRVRTVFVEDCCCGLSPSACRDAYKKFKYEGIRMLSSAGPLLSSLPSRSWSILRRSAARLTVPVAVEVLGLIQRVDEGSGKDLLRVVDSIGGVDALLAPFCLTPLQLAAERGCLPAMNVLLDAGADVNTAGVGGWTALLLAARAGQLEAVQRLLSIDGITVDAQEMVGGFTPLMYAACSLHADMTEALLQAGASPMLPSFHGSTALSMSLAAAWRLRLHDQAVEVFGMLLTNIPRAELRLVMVQQQDACGWNCLHFAAKNGLLGELNWNALLLHTVDRLIVGCVTALGLSVLHIATWNRQVMPLAEVFCGPHSDSWAATLRRNVPCSSNGYTELDLALMNGDSACAELLCTHGCHTRHQSGAPAQELLLEVILLGSADSAEGLLQFDENGVEISDYIIDIAAQLKYPASCTFTFAGFNAPIKQNMYRCLDCGVDVCIICRSMCHADHAQTPLGIVAAVCACSRDSCAGLTVVDRREVEGYRYVPSPLNTADVSLDDFDGDLDQLVTMLAQNQHEVWAQEKIIAGWAYGPEKNSSLQQHPHLIPYASLPEDAQNWLRQSVIDIMRSVLALGYHVRRRGAVRAPLRRSSSSHMPSKRVIAMRRELQRRASVEGLSVPLEVAGGADDEEDDDDDSADDEDAGDDELPPPSPPSSDGTTEDASSSRPVLATFASGSASGAGSSEDVLEGTHASDAGEDDEEKVDDVRKGTVGSSLAPLARARGPPSSPGLRGRRATAPEGLSSLRPPSMASAAAEVVRATPDEARLPARTGGYHPDPWDTSGVKLNGELVQLVETLARSTHDRWAQDRIAEGFRYSPARITSSSVGSMDESKLSPLLVPYGCLTEQEKDLSRMTVLETVKAMLAMGYVVRRLDDGRPMHPALSSPTGVGGDSAGSVTRARLLRHASFDEGSTGREVSINSFRSKLFSSFLRASARGGDTRMINRVLSSVATNGAHIDCRDNYGHTPLYLAVKRGHYSAARRLINLGAGLEERDRHGLTPLALASFLGNVRIMKLLIRNGADVIACDNSGFTPLHHACYNSNARAVELLARKVSAMPGVDVDLCAGSTAREEETLLGPSLRAVGASDRADGIRHAPAHLDVAKTRARATSMLRQLAGAVRSQLYRAASFGSNTSLRSFGGSSGSLKADGSSRDGSVSPGGPAARELCGFSPLTLTVQRGSAEVAQLLLKYGADPTAVPPQLRGLSPYDLSLRLHAHSLLQLEDAVWMGEGGTQLDPLRNMIALSLRSMRGNRFATFRRLVLDEDAPSGAASGASVPSSAAAGGAKTPLRKAPRLRRLSALAGGSGGKRNGRVAPYPGHERFDSLRVHRSSTAASSAAGAAGGDGIVRGGAAAGGVLPSSKLARSRTFGRFTLGSTRRASATRRTAKAKVDIIERAVRKEAAAAHMIATLNRAESVQARRTKFAVCEFAVKVLVFLVIVTLFAFMTRVAPDSRTLGGGAYRLHSQLQKKLAAEFTPLTGSDAWWSFMRDTMLGENEEGRRGLLHTADDGGLVLLGNNYVLGPVRVLQQRGHVKACAAPFSMGRILNGPQQCAELPEELVSATPTAMLSEELSPYVIDLPRNLTRAAARLELLSSVDPPWIAPETGSIVVVVNAYNPLVDQFVVLRLDMQFPEAGGTLNTPLVAVLPLFNGRLPPSLLLRSW
eukprot:PLAT9068.1.p1 GENE.PLAT9068.1~~PLAT9068.1.p1  ORF type:complete len:1827 (+),score=886.34 PLAT9068.1:52-5481(+)